MTKIKKPLHSVLLSLVLLLSPLIIFIGIFVMILVGGTISNEIQRFQIRNEIYSYVEENKDSIGLHAPEYTQYFEYSDWGFGDSGVIYGYIYSPNTDYSSYGEKYRKGCRIEGPTTYGYGWFYYEEICEKWYYYEEHYG